MLFMVCCLVHAIVQLRCKYVTFITKRKIRQLNWIVHGTTRIMLKTVEKKTLSKNIKDIENCGYLVNGFGLH